MAIAPDGHLQSAAEYDRAVSSRAPVRHVVVLGLMGTGKTTIGRALADRLGIRFDDSDAWLARSTGQKARELDEQNGTAHLHELEATHLLAAVAAPTRSVVAAAASVVEDPRCVAALEADGILVVLLRASVETLVERFGRDAHRPLHGTDPVAMFQAQTDRRGPVMERLAGFAVDVDRADSPERLGRVARAIAERVRG
jgi:shikimate kinase